MRVYNFSEARQKLADVLDLAKTEDVMIRRRGGDSFVISYKRPASSPFDVPGIDPGRSITADEIVEAIREERERRGFDCGGGK